MLQTGFLLLKTVGSFTPKIPGVFSKDSPSTLLSTYGRKIRDKIDKRRNGSDINAECDIRQIRVCSLTIRTEVVRFSVNSPVSSFIPIKDPCTDGTGQSQ